MALNFLDQQLKDISKQVLQIPQEITSLQNTLIDILVLKAVLQNQDNANKVFSDNFIGILNAYIDEQASLDGFTRTKYTETILDDGAQLKEGNNHFPTSPAWINFIPKLASENNGDPTPNDPANEEAKITEINSDLAVFKTGFAGGALSDTLATAYSGGAFEVVTGGFGVGQTMILTVAGAAIKGIIATVGVGITGAQAITLTLPVEIDIGTPGVGAGAANFHSGFTNSERTNEVASPSSGQTYFDFLRDNVNTKIGEWETFLDDQKTALQNNDALGAEATEITAAIVIVDAALVVLNTWQDLPSEKYSDTNLDPIETKASARPAEITARIVEIVAGVGLVTQGGDGAFSGNGQYESLFIWVNIRINKIEGTLRKFYGTSLGEDAIGAQIDTKQDKKDEYDAQFVVQTFSADADGTEFIAMNDVTGLSILDNIKVMDNDEPVVDRQIVDIQGLILELDSAVFDYTVSKQARVVKIL